MKTEKLVLEISKDIDPHKLTNKFWNIKPLLSKEQPDGASITISNETETQHMEFKDNHWYPVPNSIKHGTL